MSIGPGYACVGCKTYFRPRKNGVYVLETMEDYGTPYKIWMADLYECPDCGNQLITGYGANPVSEHFHAAFEEWLEYVTYTIEGCPKILPHELKELAKMD